MKNKNIKKPIKKNPQIKKDGWSNILTNLGIANKDKRTGARVDVSFLSQQELDAFYQSDDVAARIVDRLPEEMTREGFKVFSEDFEDLTEQVQVIFENFDLDKKIEKALKLSRLYGGAGIIFGVKDSLFPSEPINFNSISSIDYITVLDRFRLISTNSFQIDSDVSSKNFGKPLYYKIQNYGPEINSVNERIHYSRIVRFEGVDVPWQYAAQVDYWGDSVLSRLFNVIRNYQNAHDSTALIFSDYSQMIVKLKNLVDMISSGRDDLVQKRLALVAATGSIINALVIEEGEEIERKTTSVTGLPELLKMINAKLVAATDMPHTVLLGESAGGLGATGDSERLDWYDHIKNKQESILRPILKQILKFIFMAKDGPTKGIMPKNMTIEFNPLWQASEKEMVEVRKLQAETDSIYLNSGVLDPQEVADSRFGSGQYSTDTTLNKDVRNEIEKPIQEKEEDTIKQEPSE